MRRVLVIVAALTASSHALAQQEADARMLLERGTRHYDLTEYDLAIEDFKAAYELAPAPGLLFDIAQAYRLKGSGTCEEAARFYRNYLRLEPSAKNRTEVEGRIEEMDRCVAAKAPVVIAPPVTTPPPVVITPVVSPNGPRWIGWVVAGLGLAATGAGAALYASAASDWDALSKTCAGGTCAPSSWEGSRAKETAGVACMIGGGVVAVAGVVIWAAWPSSRRMAAWLAPLASPSMFGVAVGGAL